MKVVVERKGEQGNTGTKRMARNGDGDRARRKGKHGGSDDGSKYRNPE